MSNKKFYGFYNLDDRDPDKLSLVLEYLQGYFKTTSMLYLRMLGFPILKGVIVTNWNNKIRKDVMDFCKKNNFKEVLLRQDRRNETGKAPRGGYLVKLDELDDEVDKYLRMKRILVLFEPKSPYDDLYSINALFRDDSEDILLEIVGPGFDASDLQRGDITPHEIIKLPKLDVFDEDFTLTLSDIKKIRLIDPKSYRSSVKLRLVKIGKRAARLSDLQINNLNEEELINLAKSYLINENKTLLLNNQERYSPIPISYLRKIYYYIANFPARLKKIGAKSGPTMVLSMSILNEEKKLIFWDIVWPELKYKID